MVFPIVAIDKVETINPDKLQVLSVVIGTWQIMLTSPMPPSCIIRM